MRAVFAVLCIASVAWAEKPRLDQYGDPLPEEAIAPELKAARAKTANEEVRTRLDALVAKIPRERSGIEIVHARAVAAMELSASDPAKKLLAEWAAGAPGARLTIDAKAALQRLEMARR